MDTLKYLIQTLLAENPTLPKMEIPQSVADHAAAFYAHEGFAVTDCIYSELRWDEEKQMLYFEATITAADAKGTAILQTRIYDDIDGWIPPTADMGTVWQDGCTPELADALLHFYA